MQIHIPNGAGEARTHPLQLKMHKWTGGCPAVYGSVAVWGWKEKEQKVAEVDICFSHLFQRVWAATVKRLEPQKPLQRSRRAKKSCYLIFVRASFLRTLNALWMTLLVTLNCSNLARVPVDEIQPTWYYDSSCGRQGLDLGKQLCRVGGDQYFSGPTLIPIISDQGE